MELLTEEELAIVEALGRVSDRFRALEEHHPMELNEWCHGIHVLQRQVMARAARRAYPDRFTPME